MQIGIVRSTKILAASNGRSCVNCGREDGTTVRAHYSGFRSQLYGKGKGIKCHDHISADLCGPCHSKFDRYEGKKGRMSFEEKIDLSELFLHCCMMTLTRDFQEGVIS